ncbi:uncharacterized protein BDR25DRAFT_384121 [Lindgomyces ingoldianus]|uniref:Uncharacterized protein n=1 Tax=Lindgomyces ingoldianus TaxID=673940 RepID=A0ACB6R7P1_9PLEO|nr:uncharacterized protein BDR25DRAFT_384121 [Lindgomyces ingoldianus]KAF2474760.1 hypothetical protein BDR25DRAFT_384121 [Lindgomyces ingoldianus]
MKLNEHKAILNPKVLLVPYSKHHVPTYHSWMQDEDLQIATASEPLTLLQEYDMQTSWRDDADKLTFIACANSAVSSSEELQDGRLKIIPGKDDSPTTMIGDVNLFLYGDHEDEDENKTTNGVNMEKGQQAVVGEIEIMIARKDLQGQGLGKSVLSSFLWYIASYLPEILHEYHGSHGGAKSGGHLKYLRVKIDEGNVRSIKLFESVGFRKVSESPNYFKELELRWVLSDIRQMYDTTTRIVDYA